MIWGVQKCKDCGIMTKEVCQHKIAGIISYQCAKCYQKSQAVCQICYDSPRCNHKTSTNRETSTNISDTK